MKKITSIVRLMLILAFAAGLTVSANAQRGYRGGHGRSYGGYSGAYRGYSGGYRGYAGVSNYGYSPRIAGHYYSSYAYGPRYYGIPRGSISIMFGGNPYYYYGGSYYRPYGGYYQSIFPPIGLRIGVLPYGYMPLYVGPDPYYFYNGTYYRQYDDRSYEVVDAPMGAQISSLPKGAKSVMVNGEKFYELNGTYYKEDRNAKGQTVYTVVGKNGEINNSEEQQAPPLPPAAPKVGDRISELPANCRSITLNGEKLYVAPDDTYYRPEADGSFTIVGTAHSNTL